MTTPLSWTPANQSAFDIITSQLNAWGVGSLADAAKSLIQQGLDANAVTIELQNTPQYQQRFAANAERIKNGLGALSPGEYVAAESGYKQVLRQYGLPPSFYDSPSDLNSFIAKDVSPSELNQRAQIAQQVWLSNDEQTKSWWRSEYGLSDGAAIASILDPDKALPIVQRMANAAQFGGDAARQGIDADRARLEQYSDLGVTRAQFDNAATRVGVDAKTMAGIAQRFGQQYTSGTALDAELGTNANAVRARDNLVNNEQALFSSRAANDSAALGRNTSGQF